MASRDLGTLHQCFYEGLDRIEELLQQKVCVSLCHFGVKMRKDVRFWNILKHHETVPDTSFIMTVLDCSQKCRWKAICTVCLISRCTKVANQTSMRTLGGFSRNEASCWVFIWSYLECFSDLLNPGKSSIHSFHVISRMSPQDFHTSKMGWFEMSKNHPGHTDHQLWAIAHTTVRHVVVSCVIGFFIVLLGMDLTLKLGFIGFLSTWNTWARSSFFSCSPSMVLI